MKDKIIISIESHGIKHTSEASNEIDAYEFAEIVFNLMCCTGYNRENIIEGLKNIIDSFKYIIEQHDYKINIQDIVL